MTRCDAIVIGGGPAGSTAASHLVRSGRRVTVLDKAEFPREKLCTGWVTPDVVRALDLDLRDYARGRTLQPFTGFETGPMDGDLMRTDFGRVVSYGIRRCEFDIYLLRRSGADLVLGQPLGALRRDAGDWVVNEAIRAPIVIGAGGHFCPIARRLNPGLGERAIVAQEMEFVSEADSDATVDAALPKLFFWRDLLGYGWFVRKGRHLNIGAGRLGETALPARMREFTAMLRARGLLDASMQPRWKGHAYLLDTTSRRRVHGDGVLLVGDAAGLALAPSGEGILAAVESGAMAADAVIRAGLSVTDEALGSYARWIDTRFRARGAGDVLAYLPSTLMAAASRALFASRWLTRRVLLERAFLHVGRSPAL